MSTQVETAVRPMLPVLPRSNRWPVIIALITVYLIWGSTYLAIRVGVETIPPIMLTSLRYMLPGVVLFVFLRARGAPLPNRVQWRNATLIGVLLTGIATNAVAISEHMGVASGLVALAVGAVPLWASLFAGLWGSWPNRIEWVGLGLGMAGLVVLNLDSNMQSNPGGALIMIIGPMCWALGSVLAGRLSMPQGMMSIAAQMMCGGAVGLVFSVLIGERLTTAPSFESVMAGVYLGVFGALIGFTAYVYLLKAVRPALATSYAYVNPVIAVALGSIFAREPITPAAILAMFIILSGVALVMLGRERKTA